MTIDLAEYFKSAIVVSLQLVSVVVFYCVVLPVFNI